MLLPLCCPEFQTVSCSFAAITWSVLLRAAPPRGHRRCRVARPQRRGHTGRGRHRVTLSGAGLHTHTHLPSSLLTARPRECACARTRRVTPAPARGWRFIRYTKLMFTFWEPLFSKFPQENRAIHKSILVKSRPRTMKLPPILILRTRFQWLFQNIL